MLRTFSIFPPEPTRSDPIRKRMIALAEFLAGAAAIAVALMMPDGGTGNGFTLKAVLLIGGFLA